MSPELSLHDPSHVAPSGGIVGDNLGQFYGEIVFAIAPSKVQQGLVWAGTNDGQVWNTKDGAATWTNVSKGMAGLPPLGTVTSIAPSAFDAGTAYVSVDLHLVDNRDPFIYKTTDFGRSWKRVSGNLPHHELSYVRSVTEDPNCAGLLFAGTGNGVYYSLDDGEHWTALQAGLPRAPATWTVVQPTFRDLVVSTYGRGLYIFDDITPLEQLAKSKAVGDVTLFEPRPAYRFVRSPQAMLNFSLKAEPKKPAAVEILDANGALVRRLEAKGHPGINRVVWDLRYESPRVVSLRTVAPDNGRIWLEPRFRDADSRPITHWGSKPAEVGPIVAPGKYSVRLVVDGQAATQPLTVLRDPHAPGSDADIEASVKTLRQICDDISHTSDSINQIEWLRRQLETIQAMLKRSGKHEADRPPQAEEDDEDDVEPAAARPREDSAAQKEQNARLQAAAADFDGKLEAVENRLVSRALRNSDDKYFISVDGVYLNLIWLNAEVGTGGGDVAGGADFAPTQTQLGLLREYEAELASAGAAYQKLLADDLPALNRVLDAARVIPLVAP